MHRWVGKLAVVTGASSGIGAEMALRLANSGLTVVGVARRKSLIDELAKKVTGNGKIYSKKTDLSKPSEIKECFEWVDSEFGGPSILVNNAAYLSPGYISDFGNQKVSDDAIALTVDVNVTGLVLCARYAISSMKKRDIEGHIVNVNSVTGHYVPVEMATNVYPSTKHAVTSISTSLMRDIVKHKGNIKVTDLTPGVVGTALLPKELESLPKLEIKDVVDALIYVLSTPPSVNVYELGIKSIHEGLL